MARRLQSRYSDVPDEPDDIVDMLLLDFLEHDTLAQFGKSDGALRPEQRWSRERFLAWLFQCVKNRWRERRRHYKAEPITVDLSIWETIGRGDTPDGLARVESSADAATLLHTVAQLLAAREAHAPRARDQAHCFEVFAQSQFEEMPFDEDGLAHRYGVRSGTIRVWLHRIRTYLRTQLEPRLQPQENRIAVRKVAVRLVERTIEADAPSERCNDAH